MDKNKCVNRIASICLSTAILSSILVPTSALTIPISHYEELDINGLPTIVQVYEEDLEIDPNDYIRDSFESGGYLYEFSHIVKDIGETMEEDFVTVKVPISISSSSSSGAYQEALGKVAPTYYYEEEGFIGDLEPVYSSLAVTGGKSNTSSYTKTMTKTYTSSRNDNSIVPDEITADGYTWKRTGSISWSGGGFVNNTSVPSDYVATATYSRTAYTTTTSGYSASIDYEGVVINNEIESVLYVVTYKAIMPEIEEEIIVEEILEVLEDEPGFVQSFSELLFGRSIEPTYDDEGNMIHPGETSSMSDGMKVFLTVIVLLLGALLSMKAVWDLFRTYLSEKVTIMARDEMSGIDNKMQTVYFTNKNPVVTINHLKSPESRHFKIVIKAKKATALRGQTVTVRLSQNVYEHIVQDNANADYEIPIEWIS